MVRRLARNYAVAYPEKKAPGYPFAISNKGREATKSEKECFTRIYVGLYLTDTTFHCTFICPENTFATLSTARSGVNSPYLFQCNNISSRISTHKRCSVLLLFGRELRLSDGTPLFTLSRIGVLLSRDWIINS